MSPSNLNLRSLGRDTAFLHEAEIIGALDIYMGLETSLTQCDLLGTPYDAILTPVGNLCYTENGTACCSAWGIDIPLS